MKRIAVFASGNGSNFQFLVDAEKNEELAGEISLLISDKENAFVNDRAKKQIYLIFILILKHMKIRMHMNQLL